MRNKACQFLSAFDISNIYIFQERTIANKLLKRYIFSIIISLILPLLTSVYNFMSSDNNLIVFLKGYGFVKTPTDYSMVKISNFVSFLIFLIICVCCSFDSANTKFYPKDIAERNIGNKRFKEQLIKYQYKHEYELCY